MTWLAAAALPMFITVVKYTTRLVASLRAAGGWGGSRAGVGRGKNSREVVPATRAGGGAPVEGEALAKLVGEDVGAYTPQDAFPGGWLRDAGSRLAIALRRRGCSLLC